MLKKSLTRLLILLLIVANLQGASVSKTLYDDTIERLKVRYGSTYNRKINPHFLEYSLVTGNVEYSALIDEDYEIFIDTLMQRMQDIEMEDLEPKKIEWYESKEFGFVVGVLTSYAIYSTVK